MSGADLYAELAEWLKAHPQYSSNRIGLALRGMRDLGDLRKVKCCRIETVRKAYAIMRDPPAALLKRKAGPKRGQRKPATTFVQRVRSGNRRKAMERIEAGLPVGGPGSSAAITCAQRALQGVIEQQRREADPVEQALLKIRRSRRVVYRASVYGGPSDRFYISGKGSETISVPELLKMAEMAG